MPHRHATSTCKGWRRSAKHGRNNVSLSITCFPSCSKSGGGWIAHASANGCKSGSNTWKVATCFASTAHDNWCPRAQSSANVNLWPDFPMISTTTTRWWPGWMLDLVEPEWMCWCFQELPTDLHSFHHVHHRLQGHARTVSATKVQMVVSQHRQCPLGRFVQSALPHSESYRKNRIDGWVGFYILFYIVL